MYTIYKYTNIQNNKVYIGQTSLSLEERSQRGGHNYRECRRFYNAIQKYGWDSFIPTILEDNLTLEEANKKEEYYISLYNSSDDKFGYNISLGGSNRVMSDESKSIISKKAIDRYSDKTSNPMYGKKHTFDSIKKMSEAKRGDKNPMYGSVWNETQRLRCGTKGKKLNLSAERRLEMSKNARDLGFSRSKPVYCIEDEIFFDSITTASMFYNVSVSTLCGILTADRKHVKKNTFYLYQVQRLSLTRVRRRLAPAGAMGLAFCQHDIV